MKKLLLSVLAMACFGAVQAEDTVTTEQLPVAGGWQWAVDETIDWSVGSGTGILFGNAWGEIGVCDFLPVDIRQYPKFRVKVSFLNDKGGAESVQAKFQNATMAADTETYPAQSVSVNADGIIEGAFDAEFFGDDTELTVFNLQAKVEGVAVSVDEVVLIDVNGREKKASQLTQDGWGWSVYHDPNAAVAVKFNQWGQLGNWTATLDEYTTHKYTIELTDPAVAGELQWKWTDASNGDHYKDIDAGATVLEYTIDESYTNFCLQAKVACTYTIKSITRTITVKNPEDVDPSVLWSSEDGQKVMWGGGAIGISAVKMQNVQVGDIIKVNVSEVTDDDSYPQMFPAKSEWGVQTDGNIHVTEPGVYSFVMTGDMLAFAKSGGLWIRGVAFVATEVRYEPSNYTGSESSIWVGNASFDADWQGTPVDINNAHFTNNTMDAILVNYTQDADEADFTLHYADPEQDYEWFDIDNSQIQYVEGGAIINMAPMKEVVEKYGLIITGKNITVSSVEMTDAFEPESDPTAIGQVAAEQADNAWYTLSGVRVAAPQKGLYIRNGKKFIVK